MLATYLFNSEKQICIAKVGKYVEKIFRSLLHTHTKFRMYEKIE